MILKRYQNKEICSLDEFKEIVKNSKSLNEIRDTLRERDYAGWSVSAVNHRIQKENIDISHLKGNQWNKGFVDITCLQNGFVIKSSYITKCLVKLRGHGCENCHLDSWLGNPIPLEAHHIDGNRLNNDPSNLLLLCPNCHALTDNYRGRNISKSGETEHISDEEFAEALMHSKNIIQALIKLNLSPKGANYERAYKIAAKNQIKHILEH